MTHNTTRIFATIFAAVMVVSMLAPTAGAAAAMGATSGDAIDVDTSDIQTDAQFDVDENADSPDTDRLGELRAHHESDSDTEVHPSLRDATGDTVVLVSVERELGSVAGLSAADANVTKALMEDTAATQAPVIEALEGFDAEVRSEYWAGNVISAEVDLDRVDVEELAAIDGVARVSPNLEYERPAPQTDAAELDLDSEFTFGLEQINVPEFDEEFDGMGDGASVVIGDDGISNPDEGHPDLEFAEEVNVVNGEINEGLGSPGAHGEHVAGTATGAAEPVGDVPRFGVAPNADLLKANVFEGGAFTEDIIASMEWAAEEDADVASYSLGFAPEGDGSTFAPAYVDTIEDVNAAGTAAVVSAGNEGAGDIGGPVTAPATNFDSVAVGASTEAGDIATFSSGAVIDDGSVEFVGGGDSLPETFPRQYVQPDVSAPGEDVLSAGPLGGDVGDPAATYSYASGTSMAAPHYAGAIALLQSVTDEQLEPEAIENALAETAEKPDNDFAELNSRDIRYGTGIIDVHAAAQALTGDEVQTIEGTVTDAEGEPLVGATVESAEGALTSTDEDGEYTLTVTSDPAEITADEFGFASETVEVSGGEETDFALESVTEVELVQDQPQFVTPGDEFEIVVDVRNVETLTLEITEESTTDPEDVTVSLDGDELPFGEPIDLGGLDADGVALDVAVDEDTELDTEFAIEHTFGDEDDDPPAEDTVGFGDGEFLFAPGETDTVTMNTSADDVAGYEVFVDFDPDYVHIEDVEAADLEGSIATNIDNENGTFAAAQAQASGVDAPDMLDVEVTFLGEEGDTAQLMFDNAESAVFASDGEIDVDFEDATLTAGQLGDVNNDGEINAFDAILIQQFIAGEEPEDDFYPALADVTQDGEVHTGDVIAVLDIVVGNDDDAYATDDAGPTDGHAIVVVTGPTEVVDEIPVPDFEVSNLEQAEELETDEAIFGTADVTNVGNFSAQLEVLYHLRDDLDGDGDDTIVSIGPQIVDLEPGQTQTVSDDLLTIEDINAAIPDADYGPGDEAPIGFQVAEETPDFEPIDDELQNITFVEESVDGFEVTDVDPSGDFEVEPGAELEIDATVENTGDETDTQAVEFVFAGDTLADEEVELDPDEEATVTFDVTAPEEEGEYDWFVATEDDESPTWTLTVEAEETPDALTVAVVDEGNFDADDRERLDGDEPSADTGGDLVDRLEAQLDDDIVIDGLSGEEAVEAAEDGEYDAYAVNQINEEYVEDFDEYTADGSVGVVWLDQWGGTSNGVQDKSEVLNNPEETDQGLGDDPTLNVLEDHPIFDGIEDDSFLIHTLTAGDFTTFDEYDGEVVGEVDAGDGGGDAIAADEEKGTILLSSFGSASFVGGDDYTEEADMVVGNAVEYVAGEDDDDGAATFEVADVDPSGNLTVEPGTELSIDATVENTGDETGMQAVEFVFAGDTLADEEVELEAGEEATVTFEVTAPEEEGEYDWYIATEDDESPTWTLTVEAEETPDATTVAIVDSDLDTETLRLELEERGLSNEEIEATLDEFDPDEMNEFSQTVRDGLDDDEFEVVDVSSEDLLDNTHHDVYVVSEFEAELDITEFQDEISDDTGVVYADSWSSTSTNSLNALVSEIGDPAETDTGSFDDGDVVLELTDDHPLFDGVGEAGDVITHMDGDVGSTDRRWFSDYSGGEVIADIGVSAEDDTDGAAIGVSDDGDEVILASHARWSDSFTPDEAFTEESNQILFNAIEYVASDDGDTADSDDDVESVTAAPLLA